MVGERREERGELHGSTCRLDVLRSQITNNKQQTQNPKHKTPSIIDRIFTSIFSSAVAGFSSLHLSMTKKKAVAASACFIVLAAGDIGCYAFANGRGKKITPSTLYSVPYLPNIEEEGDDGSFFLAASQQAAKDRFEMLKKGMDPLAISLSSVPLIAEEQESAEKEVDEAPTVNKSPDNKGQTGADEKMKVSSPTVENDDYDGMLSSLSESPLTQSLEEKKNKIEAGIEPSTTLDEITRVESEIAAIKSEIKDKIQSRKDDANSTYDANQPVVGEGSTAEEMETARYTRLAAADEIAKKLNSGEDLPLPPVLEGAGATSEEAQERTAEESEAIREARLAAADEIAKSFRKSVDDSTSSPTTKSLTLSEDDNEEDEAKDAKAEPVAAAAKAKNIEEPSNANQPLLSSDGKLIYEPSHAALNMNQENVENGLLLLSRSFLMLNSIVQRHLGEEEDNE